jgi:small-conductance mechanosensitive channel
MGLLAFEFLLYLVIWLLVAGLTATYLGLAWRRWYVDLPRLKEPKWRSVTLLSGMVAGSINALLSHGWLWYCWSHPVRSAHPIIFAGIGAGICVLALLAAIVGSGGACRRLADAAALGVLGWAFVFFGVILID